MKTLFSFVFVSLLGLSANAEQVLLKCSIYADSRRDVQTVVVADTSAGLVLRQITRGGAVTESALPERQWSSHNIRLKDDRNGFRYLRKTYSEVFREFGWFVIGTGPGYRSEGRANCR